MRYASGSGLESETFIVAVVVMVKVSFITRGGRDMLSLFIFILVIASLADDRNEGRRILYAAIRFFAVIWCIRILAHVGFALLPCIIIFMILGKVVFPFLRGFFSRF